MKPESDDDIPPDFTQLVCYRVPVDTERQIRSLFEQCGIVIRCRQLPPRRDGLLGSAAYITMDTHDQARRAIKKFHGQMLNGSNLVTEVFWDRPSLPRYSRRISQNSSVSRGGPSVDSKINLYCKIDGNEVVVGSITSQIAACLISSPAIKRAESDRVAEAAVSGSHFSRTRFGGNQIAANIDISGENENGSIAKLSSTTDPITSHRSVSTLYNSFDDGLVPVSAVHIANVQPVASSPIPEPPMNKNGRLLETENERIVNSQYQKGVLSETAVGLTGSLPREAQWRQNSNKNFSSNPTPNVAVAKTTVVSPGKMKIQPASALRNGNVFGDGMPSRIETKSKFWVTMLWLEEEHPIAHLWVSETPSCEMPLEVVKTNTQISAFYAEAVRVDPYRPMVDGPVAVYVEEYRTWSRGRVEEILEDSAITELIDLGGFAETRISSNFVQPLDQRFAEQPALVLRAIVGGISGKNYDAKMQEDLLRLFGCSTEKRVCRKAFIEEFDRNSPTPTLRIFDQEGEYDVDFAVRLVEKSQIRRGIFTRLGIIFYVNDPVDGDSYDLIMVDTERLPVLKKIQENVRLEAEQRKPPQLEPGFINAVQNPEDNRWYRCYIAEILSKEKCRVELFDYGGFLNVFVSELVGLSAGLQVQTPCLTCRIDGLDASRSARSALYPTLRSFCGEIFVYFLVREEGKDIRVISVWNPADMSLVAPPGSSPPVCGAEKLLKRDEKSVNFQQNFPIFFSENSDFRQNSQSEKTSQPSSTTNTLCESRYLTMRDVDSLKRYSVGDSVDVTVTFVLDGEWFTAVTDPSYWEKPEFMEMMTDIDAFCATAPVLTELPPENALVYARFGEDAVWYRAIILNHLKDKEEVLVLFLDYGNTSKVKFRDLRRMDKKFIRISFGCLVLIDDGYIPAVNDDWTEEELKIIAEKIVNKNSKFQITKIFAENGYFGGRLFIPDPKNENGSLIGLGDELVRIRLAEQAATY